MADLQVETPCESTGIALIHVQICTMFWLIDNASTVASVSKTESQKDGLLMGHLHRKLCSNCGGGWTSLMRLSRMRACRLRHAQTRWYCRLCSVCCRCLRPSASPFRRPESRCAGFLSGVEGNARWIFIKGGRSCHIFQVCVPIWISISTSVSIGISGRAHQPVRFRSVS